MQTSADTNVDTTTPGTPPQRPVVAVVPVAGKGTRLRPLSNYIPKELLPVGSRLALWRIVEELSSAGIERVIFVVSPEKQEFVERCFSDAARDAERLTMSSIPHCEYVLQERMQGLGDAIGRAASLVGDQPFVVALGDAVYEEPEPGCLSRRLIDAFVNERAGIALAVQAVPVERISRYGIIQPSAGNLRAAVELPDIIPIRDIIEKPAPENAPSNLAAAARYVVTPEVFSYLERTAPDAKGEVQFTHALQALLRDGIAGRAVPLHPGEVRHDIGSLDSYYRAFVTFALQDPEYGAPFRDFLQQKLQESPRRTDENRSDF